MRRTTLIKISEKLEQLATLILETTKVPGGNRSTAETWTAIRLLRDASRDVWSAALNLELHDEKYGHLDEEEE